MSYYLLYSFYPYNHYKIQKVKFNLFVVIYYKIILINFLLIYNVYIINLAFHIYLYCGHNYLHFDIDHNTHFWLNLKNLDL